MLRSTNMDNAIEVLPPVYSRIGCTRWELSLLTRQSIISKSGCGTPSSRKATICPLRRLIVRVSGPEYTNNVPVFPLNASILRMDWRPNVCKSPSIMRSCCSHFIQYLWLRKWPDHRRHHPSLHLHLHIHAYECLLLAAFFVTNQVGSVSS